MDLVRYRSVAFRASSHNFLFGEMRNCKSEGIGIDFSNYINDEHVFELMINVHSVLID